MFSRIWFAGRGKNYWERRWVSSGLCLRTSTIFLTPARHHSREFYHDFLRDVLYPALAFLNPHLWYIFKHSSSVKDFSFLCVHSATLSPKTQTPSLTVFTAVQNKWEFVIFFLFIKAPTILGHARYMLISFHFIPAPFSVWWLCCLVLVRLIEQNVAGCALPSTSR